MSDARVMQGHVLDALAAMPAESVHCVVTSPPYWGLRDYGLPLVIWGGEVGCGHEWPNRASDPLAVHNETQGRSVQTGRFLCKSEPLTYTGRADVACPTSRIGTAIQVGEYAGPKMASKGAFCRLCGAWRGQLGLEPTIDLYVEHIVAVFREVRRVLRKDGTLWLNMGDCYAGSGAGGGGNKKGNEHGQHSAMVAIGRPKPCGTLKPKDLVGQPWRVAFALQADGWWLRSDIVWAKRNPMPESTTDRPTRSHEFIFLLTKAARYFYDADAVREASTNRNSGNKEPKFGDDTGRPGCMIARSIPYVAKPHRNLRSVWHLSTQPTRLPHYATFPDEIPRRAILAGTSAKGCCPECGAPWERVIERHPFKDHKTTALGKTADGHYAAQAAVRSGAMLSTVTLGWQPTCECGRRDGTVEPPAPVPCMVLDPFAGIGTTLRVAKALGRSAIGIELSEKYVRFAEQALANQTPGLALG